ncbi:hypothetical protein B0J17DRAFT_680293 [Rhizoctonia solani]|nr:hypothetical protein B0J17DRAFT_680293 [Rhizoctonia solani]
MPNKLIISYSFSYTHRVGPGPGPRLSEINIKQPRYAWSSSCSPPPTQLSSPKLALPLIIEMLAILEPFCPPAMVGTTRLPTSSEFSRQETVVVAVDQLEVTTLTHPLTGIVAEPRAKQVIVEMLDTGIPEAVIRPIFDTGYYEIVLSFEPASAPYIAITYTNDIGEGHIHGLNSRPTQDPISLTVPELGMTAVERGEWEEEVWDGLQWDSFEYLQESGEVDAIPWPVLYTIAEFDDLEPVSGLRIYFAGCDYALDPSTPTTDSGIQPWCRSKSNSSSAFGEAIGDWSENYELGDSLILGVADESVASELDSSTSTNSDSDLELDWFDDTETELSEPSFEEAVESEGGA